MTHSRRQLTELFDRWQLQPRRSLGQNFVADPNTVRRIARLARVGPGDRVVEIGAGLGSLTLALCETGATVTAIEIDRQLVPVLREVVGPCGVEVIEGDALRLDWSPVLGERPHVLVANLPYNIATPLVLDLLAFVPQLVRMLVLVQREVAERLAAGPGSAAYGIPSVKRAWWAGARLLGTVPPTVFVPRPRVSSALVELVRHEPPAADPAATFRLVEAGFGQRRKMLRSALASRVTPAAFAAAGIDPADRAERLGVEDWLRLARAAGRLTPDSA